jgi:hypothetical protein
VIDAPFSVNINSPTLGCIATPFDVIINIFNKTDTMEKLSVQVDLCEDFIITGGTTQGVEVLCK